MRPLAGEQPQLSASCRGCYAQGERREGGLTEVWPIERFRVRSTLMSLIAEPAELGGHAT